MSTTSSSCNNAVLVLVFCAKIIIQSQNDVSCKMIIGVDMNYVQRHSWQTYPTEQTEAKY